MLRSEVPSPSEFQQFNAYSPLGVSKTTTCLATKKDRPFKGPVSSQKSLEMNWTQLALGKLCVLLLCCQMFLSFKKKQVIDMINSRAEQELIALEIMAQVAVRLLKKNLVGLTAWRKCWLSNIQSTPINTSAHSWTLDHTEKYCKEN